MFVLAFCIFRKEEYRLRASPALQDFKFRHFGHDMVVLHERDIRKATGQFSFLVDVSRREPFIQDLTRLIDETPFTLVASVIKKADLRERYAAPPNPYHIALAFGMERESLPFDLTLADKRTNCCGLQLADLIARPIGRKLINAEEQNRAYDVIQKKFYRNGARLRGFGLKTFP